MSHKRVMDDLKKTYAQQMAVYEAAIKEGQPPEKIAALNMEISKTLEDMIAILAQVKRDESGRVQEYRGQLLSNLQRIQRDYNGLTQSTDRLETLRRIRQEEKDPSEMWRYLYFFFGLVVVLFLMIFVFGSQKEPTAAAMPINPAIATTFR